MSALTGKGFITRRIVTDEQNNPTAILEVLYWICPETGAIFQSQEKRISHDFHAAQWQSAKAIPENAEFIGNYFKPTGI